MAKNDLPQILYSDNGTNVVRTNREIKKLQKSIQMQNKNIHIPFILKNEAIERKLDPAGIWESHVKIDKLKRL